MQSNLNPKIVGAAVIGFALVGAAYTFGSIGQEREVMQPASVQAAEPPTRVAITVTDIDQNGIEDWRDEFITTEPIIIDALETTYVPPDTLTGELGVSFMENIISARGFGPFGRTDEQVIGDTVEILSQTAAHEIYDTPDIIILGEWTDQDIVNYANSIASAINRNNLPNMDSELVVLQSVVAEGDASRITELSSLAEAYARNRDDTLNTPVPAFLVKEHLDLINTFHAVHKDIEAMTMALDDPAFTLLRLKRYEDDATGLGIALQNMFFALEEYSYLIDATDPAVLFVLFSPDLNI